MKDIDKYISASVDSLLTSLSLILKPTGMSGILNRFSHYILCISNRTSWQDKINLGKVGLARNSKCIHSVHTY